MSIQTKALPQHAPDFSPVPARQSSRLLVLVFLFLLLPILFLAAAPFNVADAGGPWLDGDYGVLIYSSSRVLNGEMLYRDFWSLYTPALFYLIAFLFRIFGESIVTIRIALAVAGLGTAYLVFHFTRSLSSRTFAVLAALFAFILGPISINYPYTGWFCAPLGLGMVALEHLAWKKGAHLYNLAAGMAAGLIFSFKINWGLFAFAALFSIQVLESGLDENRAKSAKFSAPLAFAVAALFLVPLFSAALIRNDLSMSNISLFLLPSLLIPAAGMLLFRSAHKQKTRLRFDLFPLLFSFVGFLVVVLPWVIFFSVQLGLQGVYTGFLRPMFAYSEITVRPMPAAPYEAAALLGLILMQGFLIVKKRRGRIIRIIYLLLLWSFELLLLYKMLFFLKSEVLPPDQLYSKWGFAFACYLPLAVHVGIAFCIYKELFGQDKRDLSKVHLLLGAWVYSILAFHAFFPVMEIYHLLWMMAPLIVLAAAFIYRSFIFWKDGKREFLLPAKSVALASAAIIPLFVAVVFGKPIFRFFMDLDHAPSQISLAKFSALESPRGGILLPQKKAMGMNGVLQFIALHSAPEDYILDGTGSIFYFLADRRNPTGWIFYETYFLSPEDISEYKRRVNQASPPVAVTSYASEIHLALSLPEIYKFIQSKYEPAMTFGAYRVWVLKSAT